MDERLLRIAVENDMPLHYILYLDQKLNDHGYMLYLESKFRKEESNDERDCT